MAPRRRALILLLLIIALGTFLRLYHLSSLSLWTDEAYAVLFVKNHALSDIMAGRELDPGIPPFFYVLLSLWTKLLGFGKVAVRALPALFGILSIPMMYLLGKKLLGRGAGLIAALLLAASPFHVEYSQMARGYTLVMLLSMLSIYSYLRILDGSRKRPTIALFVGSTVLACYTHYFAGLIILFQNAHIFFAKRHEKGLLRAWLKTQCAVLLLLTPLLLLFLKSLASLGAVDRYFSLLLVPYTFLVFSVGNTGFLFRLPTLWSDLVSQVPYLLAACAIFLAILVLAAFRSRTDRASVRFPFLYLLIPTALLLLIGLASPAFRPRYLIVAFPAYLLVLAAGITSVKKRWLNATLTGLVLLAFLPPLYTYYFTFEREPWDAVAKHVQDQERPGQIILTTTFEPLRYAYQGDLKIVGFWDDYKPWAQNSSGIWFINAYYSQSNATEKRAAKDWLDREFAQESKTIFPDESNELSGDFEVYYYGNYTG